MLHRALALPLFSPCIISSSIASRFTLPPQMRNWYIRFPTILQACGCIIEMLRRQYAHSVGYFSEAALHYIEAAKALDLVGPVFRMMDSFVGVREKTCSICLWSLVDEATQSTRSTARGILRSFLTLAKKLYDVSARVWVLSVLTALYQELGEKGNELENSENQRSKLDDLQKRLADAHSFVHHVELETASMLL